MKRTTVISMLLAMTRVMLGGESSLTTTYQPLEGLGSSEIAIVQVTCHDWFSHILFAKSPFVKSEIFTCTVFLVV